MQNNRPPHPGTILLERHLQPFGLSVTKAARLLSISRTNFSRLVNGRAGVSALMNLQMGYDLWHAKRKLKLKK